MACVDSRAVCSASATIRRFALVGLAHRLAILIIIMWLILPIHTLIFANILPPGNVTCIILQNDVAIVHGIYTTIMGGLVPPTIMLLHRSIQTHWFRENFGKNLLTRANGSLCFSLESRCCRFN
ncbi:unnamed protein product [Rotaria magnacalcarata]|uniref:Uncharacterized protein n=1 Tax=Rotaria magnacalcarata TaxID=392030 RepID=A0A815Z876_9BILA|nr:unnamed protein product [Rotaria magnacalcarata]CAF3791123.1 unnamed protein product [Rotaria magnacalcarata]